MFIQCSGNCNIKDISIFPHSYVMNSDIVSTNSSNFKDLFNLLLSSNSKISDLFILTSNKWTLFGKLSCEGHKKLQSCVFC
jgi:hypothetical protein